MINFDKISLDDKKQKHRLGGSEELKLSTNSLNDYELVIASHLVVPDDIAVSWSDIAGLESVIDELRESVVLPIRHRHLFANSTLWEAPKGEFFLNQNYV